MTATPSKQKPTKAQRFAATRALRGILRSKTGDASSAEAWAKPRRFSPTPFSSNIQKPNGDFVGRPLAGAFSERAQARCLRQSESIRLGFERKIGRWKRDTRLGCSVSATNEAGE